MFPLYLRNTTKQDSLLSVTSTDEAVPNLSVSAESYIEGLKADAENVFYHVLAVLHAQQYESKTQERFAKTGRVFFCRPRRTRCSVLLHSVEDCGAARY